METIASAKVPAVESARQSVGIVGLGEMGLPMTRRLFQAGWEVRAFDADDATRAAATAEGIPVVSSTSAVARRSDVVIVMVPSRYVGDVIEGAGGLLAAGSAGLIVIEGGNSDPRKSMQYAADFAAEGMTFLDVGFSGGPLGAAAGTLAVMVGGDRDAFVTTEPILRTVGRRVDHFGQSGNGHLAKAINHLVQGLTAQAIGEALAIAEAAGIDPRAWATVVAEGAAGSWLMERALEMLAGPAADPTRVSEWWMQLGGRNQLTYSLEFALANGLSTPLAAVGQQVRTLSLGTDRSDAMQRYVNLTWELAHRRTSDNESAQPDTGGGSLGV